MSLNDVQHQSRARRLVRFALETGRMPHAYIFHGPEGVGRELFASRLARILTCNQPAAAVDGGIDACERCQSCELDVRGAHPDVHVVHRELHKMHPDTVVRNRKGLELAIDVVRHFVIREVANKPLMGRGKVFILRESEKLNPEAQNALLKTLEEPPPTTFLILISTSLDVLLPTVRSRCQIIPFGLLPTDFVVNRLPVSCPDITRDAAERCAFYAGGSLGAAGRYHEDGLVNYESIVDDALADVSRGAPLDASKRIIDAAKQLGECFEKRDPEISDTEAQRRGLRAVLSLIAMAIRRTLHESAPTPSGGAATVTATAVPLACIKAIHAVAAAERRLDQNANVQLCVDVLLIELSHLLRTAV